MFPKDLSQSSVQEMGRGVIVPDGPAAVMVDGRVHGLPDLQTPGHHADLLGPHLGNRVVGVFDDGRETAVLEKAAVADLASGFGVERRAVQDDVTRLPRFQRLDPRTVPDQGQNLGLGHGLGVIAGKEEGRAFQVVIDPALFHLGVAFPGLPGPRLLLFQLGLEAGLVHSHPLLQGQVLGQVEGKSIGIIELERGLARQGRPPAAAGIGDILVEDAQARAQGQGETLLLGLADLGHQGQRGEKLRISRFHALGDDAHERVDKGLLQSQAVAVAEGPADEAAENIAAAVVGRHDAVGDHEGRGPGMVGDDGASSRGDD